MFASMSLDDLDVQRQCQTCLKSFPANKDLRVHLESYKSQERILSAEVKILSSRIEECRAHLTTIDENNRSDDEEDSATLDPKRHKPRYCPSEGCGKTFKKRGALIRHFEQHVPCSEVCVYCFQQSSVVSIFKRHVTSHAALNETKTGYLTRICDELREQSILILDHMLESQIIGDSNCPKRGLESTGLESDTATSSKRFKEQLDLSEIVSGSSLNRGFPVQISDEQGLPMQPEVDIFAPPLFYYEPDAPAHNFDAPMFEAITVPNSHTVQANTRSNLQPPASNLNLALTADRNLCDGTVHVERLWLV